MHRNNMQLEILNQSEDDGRLHFSNGHIIIFNAIDMANLKVIN